MNTQEKQAVLDVLNSLEVIERQGGEDAYMLVSDSAENRDRLRSVGITDKEIDDTSANGMFCALSIAFSGNYADSMRNWKLYLWGPIDDELRYRVLEGRGTPEDAYRLLRELEPNLFGEVPHGQ